MIWYIKTLDAHMKKPFYDILNIKGFDIRLYHGIALVRQRRSEKYRFENVVTTHFATVLEMYLHENSLSKRLAG